MTIKRSRPTSVCLTCRDKKIKCDKLKPVCSSCIKFGTECSYIALQVVNGNEHSFKKARNNEINKVADAKYDPLLAFNNLLKQVEQLELTLLVDNPYEFEPRSIKTEVIPNNDETFASDQGKDVSNHYKLRVPNLIHSETDDKINLFQLQEALQGDSSVKNGFLGLLTGHSILQTSSLIANLYSRFSNSWTKDRFINSFGIQNTSDLGDQKYIGGFNILHGQTNPEENPTSNKLKAYDFEDTGKIFQTRKTKLNEKNKLLGLMFFSGELEGKIELITKIKAILPNRKVISLLVERFFKDLYALFPVLDEEDFTSNITRIIGPLNFKEEDLQFLNVEKRLDFAYLGILLIMLRLSYLSLFTNIQSINEKYLYGDGDIDQNSANIKYLFNIPVNIEVFNVAKICLNQFNLVSSSNLLILQFAILIGYYTMYGPEIGNESSELMIFSSLLIKMAVSMGLHREPDKFKSSFKDEKVKNLRRKIWKCLCFLDVFNCLAIGCPINTTGLPIDVNPPFTTDSNANVKDKRLDSFVSTSLNAHPTTFDKLNNVFRILSNVNEPFSISLVDGMIEECFDLFADSPFDYWREFQADEGGRFLYFVKSYKLKYCLQVASSLLVLRFHFLNYYFKISDSTKTMHYGIKNFSVFYDKVYPIISELLTNENRRYNDICELVVTPSLHNIINVAMLINLTFYMRVKLLNDVSPPSIKSIAANLSTFEKLLLESSKILIGFMNIIGNRYYNSWKSTKILNFLLDEAAKTNLSEKYSDVEILDNFGFDDNLLRDFCNIIESALTKSASRVQNGVMDKSTNNSNDSLWILIVALRQKEKEKGLYNNVWGGISSEITDLVASGEANDDVDKYKDSTQAFGLKNSNIYFENSKELPQMVNETFNGFDGSSITDSKINNPFTHYNPLDNPEINAFENTFDRYLEEIFKDFIYNN